MKAGKEMDTLVAKRDVAHHEGRQLVEAEWVEIPAFPRSGDRGIEDFLRRRRLEQLRVRPAVRSRIAGPPGVQATEYACRWFFPEVRDRDAFTVCAQYLERVRAAAAECVARYMA